MSSISAQSKEWVQMMTDMGLVVNKDMSESGAGGDRAIAGGYDGRYGESARGTLEHDGLGRAGHPGLVVDGDCDRTGISF